jgi:hypothetical protein
MGVAAQNDVMMQGFYWDVPVDAVNNNGTWWTNLKNKSTHSEERRLQRHMGTSAFQRKLWYL